MIRDGDFADVVQQNTALQHPHESTINKAREGRQAHRFLSQHADVGLHAPEVATGLQATQLRHLGHGEDENVLRLVQVAVVHLERLFQLVIRAHEVVA